MRADGIEPPGKVNSRTSYFLLGASAVTGGGVRLLYRSVRCARGAIAVAVLVLLLAAVRRRVCDDDHREHDGRHRRERRQVLAARGGHRGGHGRGVRSALPASAPAEPATTRSSCPGARTSSWPAAEHLGIGRDRRRRRRLDHDRRQRQHRSRRSMCTVSGVVSLTDMTITGGHAPDGAAAATTPRATRASLGVGIRNDGVLTLTRRDRHRKSRGQWQARAAPRLRNSRSPAEPVVAAAGSTTPAR